MKYVVIFGFPSIFAHLDNMQPFDGPICIARVTLYSKMWRYFDRGLYSFFKTYIFVPICAPSFSIGRRIIGVLISFAFVLLWHGCYYHNVVSYYYYCYHYKWNSNLPNTKLPNCSTKNH